MPLIKEPIFQTVFNQLREPRIVVKTNEAYTIVLINDTYEATTGYSKKDIVGKSLWDVFRPDGSRSNTTDAFSSGLAQAVISGEEQKLPIFRSDIVHENSSRQLSRWWQVEILPLTDQSGVIEYLMCTTRNITVQIDNEKAAEEIDLQNTALLIRQDELKTELADARSALVEQKQAEAQRSEGVSDTAYQLQRIFDTTPMGLTILQGKDFVVQRANKPVLTLWGRESKDVIGKKLMDVFPELEGQPFPEFLRSVRETGKTVSMPEIPVTVVMPNGTANHIYVDFSYDPLYDTNGNVDAILVSVNEITALIKARMELQNRQEELEAMNEEIISVNEEYAATNEELTATNEELNEAQQELLQLYENFVESKRTSDRLQQQFRLAVSTADLGSWSIDMSTRKLTMSDRLRDIFGLPLDGDVSIEHTIPAIDPEFKDIVLAELRNGLENFKDVNLEYPINNLLTGKRIWVRATGKMFMDEHNTPKHFSGVYMDITERKLDEIRKNDFIGIVSHELKTPLTSMKGYLQLINRQATKENLSFYESMSKKAIASVNKMETLVRGFLNVARFGSGKIYLDMQKFDLGEMLEAIIDEQRILSDTHKIVYVPCVPVQIFADRDKIGQVASNFLSNAIKYSPEETTITVRCEEFGDRVRVGVTDQGMGVKKGDMDKVFDRFFRVEEPASRHIAGFGIGLYLCSEIILRHNGRIWVESKPNNGSTFFFEISVNAEKIAESDIALNA